MSELHFREARHADAPAVIPLIYSSGPQAFEYGFSAGGRKAAEFLDYAFRDGRGLFGWRNHAVAVEGKTVVGVGSFYSGQEYPKLSNQLVIQFLRFYPVLALPGLIRRALDLHALLPPPDRDTQYVANLGVRSDRRSHGIGAALIRYQQARAIAMARRVMALDVAVSNPNAQALYERLGFVLSAEQRFRGPPGAVPDARRLQMPL